MGHALQNNEQAGIQRARRQRQVNVLAVRKFGKRGLRLRPRIKNIVIDFSKATCLTAQA